jgi:hypothetical protein
MLKYVFELENGTRVRFDVDPERMAAPSDPSPGEPEWVALEYQQCDNCPLDRAACRRCPAAADLLHILQAFRDVDSTARAVVYVRTHERTYMRRCDVQTGLGSLLGLVMATSGCPILARMQPMARTHLPFASIEETIYRTASAYLLGQYFVARRGGTPDFELDGLRDLYAQLSVVNVAFARRIRAAAQRDAGLNAITQLFSLGTLVSLSLDEDLDLVAPMFEAKTQARTEANTQRDATPGPGLGLAPDRTEPPAR